MSFNTLKSKSIQHTLVLVISSALILAWLYPFWFLGNFSLLGWLDEIYAQIPWYFVSKNAAYGDFIHEFAGGAAVVFGYGAEHISLYRSLIQSMSVEHANLTMRFLGALTYFSGLYLILIKTFKQKPWFSAILAIGALLINEGPYGWTLGGMGWDFSIAIWMIVACLGIFQNKRVNMIVGVTTILIGATVSSPVFVFYFTAFTGLIALSLLPEAKVLIKTRWKLWTGLAVLMLLVFVVNWSSLFYVTLGAADFSTRLLGTLAKQQPALEFGITSFLNELERTYRTFINIGDYAYVRLYQLYLFVPILALSLIWLRITKLTILIAFSCIAPALLQALARSMNIPILGTYQWIIIWQMLPVFLAFYIAVLANYQPKWVISFGKNFPFLGMSCRYFGFAVATSSVVCFAFLATSFLHDVSIAYLSKRNSAGMMNQYQALQSLPHQHFRSVTDNKTLPWSLPLYYGIETFDGMQPAFPERKTYFMGYAVSTLPKDSYTKSHFLNFYSDRVMHDPQMLAMANVKYILSTEQTLEPKSALTKVLSLQTGKIDDNTGFSRLLTGSFIDRYGITQPVKPVNVFEISRPWPRVFAPIRIQYSDNTYKSLAYHEELKKLDYKHVLIAVDDLLHKKEINHTVVESFDLTNTGVNIRTNGRTGAVVYDQVYTPYWRAYCGNDTSRFLPITPVNGIMMMVYVTKSCDSIFFSHYLHRANSSE